MKSIKKYIAFASFFLVLLMSATTATHAQKIAHVDSDAIIPAMPEYKKAQSEIEAYGKQLEKQLKGEEEKVMSYYQSVMQKAQAGTLSPAEQKQEEEKLMQMQQELQKKALEADEKLAKKRQELTNPLFDKFQNALEKVAKENGYAYVFDKKLLLYSDGGIDATAKVKEALGLGW